MLDTLEKTYETNEKIKEKRRAFFIVHPEGSGGYMLTEALVAAGCHWEQWHESFHENYYFEDMPSPFVFHRSIPHRHVWEYIPARTLELLRAFDHVCVLAIVREPNSTIQSVLRRDSERDLGELSNNIISALYHINGIMSDRVCDSVFITYEAFCLSEGFRRWLFEERLQLPYPEDFEIKYANDQYYDE